MAKRDAPEQEELQKILPDGGISLTPHPDNWDLNDGLPPFHSKHYLK